MKCAKTTGTWSDMQGADNVTDCQLCPLGTFSVATGAISQATCNPCGQGKYANQTGTATELQCYRCPMASLLSTCSMHFDARADHHENNRALSWTQLAMMTSQTASGALLAHFPTARVPLNTQPASHASRARIQMFRAQASARHALQEHPPRSWLP